MIEALRGPLYKNKRQPLIKFVSQNHSDDSVDSHGEYKVHRHTHIRGMINTHI